MYVLILKGLGKGSDGCVDCGAFREIGRGLRGARRQSGARIRDWGIKRKSRARPGGWTQAFTRESIVYQEGLVKIIIQGKVDFLREKRAREKRDSSHKRRAMGQSSSHRRSGTDCGAPTALPIAVADGPSPDGLG